MSNKYLLYIRPFPKESLDKMCTLLSLQLKFLKVTTIDGFGFLITTEMDLRETYKVIYSIDRFDSFDTFFINSVNKYSWKAKLPIELIELTTEIENDYQINKTINIDKDYFSNIIGLEDIKSYFKKLQKFLIIENKRKSTTKMSLHMIFKGPPGTGKTTIARKLGKLYKDLGYLRKGHVVEVDRNDLVAGYVGQTAKKTKIQLNKALDGILFIDEAYSLTDHNGNNDFGNESINTIIKFMEDNRERLVVIVAGYTKNMNDFINSNPGLKSRFNKSINFSSYNAKELCEIFKMFCHDKKMLIDKNLQSLIYKFLKKLIKRNNNTTFGNGREVRNLFESMLLEQSNRININESDEKKISTFRKSDLINTAKNNYNIRMIQIGLIRMTTLLSNVINFK